MNPNVLTAAISAGAAVITAVVALIVNSRGFVLLDKRIDDLRADTNRRFDETNRRFDRIEADLEEFFKVLTEHDKRIQRLEDKQ